MNYQKQATDFLSKHGITFSAVLIGSDCPMFCTDAEKSIDMDKVDVYPRRSHIHGKHYRCTFAKNVDANGHPTIGAEQKRLTIEYWNSYQDEEYNAWRFGHPAIPRDYPYWDRYKKEWNGKRKNPTPYDVLAILTKSDLGTFTDFCSDYGYDYDSMKAERTYHAVMDEWRKVRQFFTAEELAEVQEIV